MPTPEAAVTVIIVNYNAGVARLTRVLTALDQQTFREFDVVLLDNASHDKSAEEIDLDAVAFPMTRVFNKENTGFAGGVMDALPHAKGRYLAFLNPDAYPDAGWLEALHQAAEAYGPRTALGSIQYVEGTHDAVLDGLGDVYHISGVAWRGGFGKAAAPRLPVEDREVFAPCFAAAMVERDWFCALGGLDREFFCYHEDVDFGFRNRLAGGNAVLVRRAIVRHEGSAISGRYSSFTVEHGIRNRMWTLIKNMPLAASVVAVPAYLVFSVGFLVRSFMLRIGVPYLKGMAAGLRGARAQWRKRRTLAPMRRVSVQTILSEMSWSPIAPFRRAPDLRPVTVDREHAADISAPDLG